MISKILLKPNFELGEVLKHIHEFESHNESPVIVITGPTSSGKTNLAHKINSELNSILISADSRQIYKETTIGSNKPHIIDKVMIDGEEASIVEEDDQIYLYWNIDKFDLDVDYSAQKFREVTRYMINDLHNKKILPILVGGTIHWIRSLTNNFISPFYISDENLYKELCALPLSKLQEKYLENYGKNEVNESDWNNTRRLSRAIEYKLITGKSLYESTRKIDDKNNYLVFQIEINRISHREKIRQSIQDRISRGWINEVKDILNKYPESILDKLGQGYRIIGEYILIGESLSQDDLIEKITIAEMRYAKKQIY